MGEDEEMVDFDAAEERVVDWEKDLPNLEDLTPLSQTLIPPELASAFSITLEPCRTMLDVNRASQNTITRLRRRAEPLSENLKSLPSFSVRNGSFNPEGEDGDAGGDPCSPQEDDEGSKGRSCSEREADMAFRAENSNDDQSARTLKRPRLVWTPQLHKRFVDVVAHLGIKSAVPKTIMQLMNVEGLTRENVASHLQKYRLYLKRMQGFPSEGPSSSDQLFASTPVPSSVAGPSFLAGNREESSGAMPIPVPYVTPFVSMPVIGMPQGHGSVAMPVNPPPQNGFASHPYNAYNRNLVPQRMSSGEQHRDWSYNKIETVMRYPHATPNNK
ncbi:unnamed protein product [Victoria cruziana]